MNTWLDDEDSAKPNCDPPGPVADAITAMAQLFVMEDRAEAGEPVPQKLLDRQTGRARDAVAGLSLYPLDVRLCIVAPLVELGERLSLEGLIPEMLDTVAAPQDPLDSEKPQAVQASMDRLLASTVRMMVATDEWSEDFESILGIFRDVHDKAPDDEVLTGTLQQALLFHAWKAREELLCRNRQKLVDDEPLPSALAQALACMTKAFDLSRVVPQCLHLALVDALAAGLVPQRSNPRTTVAAMFYAWAVFDTAEEDDDDTRENMIPDVRELTRWARCKPRISSTGRAS